MTDEQLDKAMRELFAEYDELDVFLKRQVPELDHGDQISKYQGYQFARGQVIQRADNKGCRTRLEQAIAGYQSELGIGSAAPIPEAIDRGTQWKLWDSQYRAARQSVPGAAQIFILPCIGLDAPTAFVKRVKTDFERRARAQRESAIRYPAIITWDDCTGQNAIREEYCIKLFQKLNVPDEDLPERSAKAIREHLQRSKYVLIETRIQAEEFGAELTPFLRWLAAEYWSGFEAKDQHVLLFVHLEYGETPPPERHAQLTRELTFNGGCPLTVLPVLGEITVANLRTWAGEFPDVDVDEEAKALAAGAKSMRKFHVLKSIENWQRKRQQERQAR